MAAITRLRAGIRRERGNAVLELALTLPLLLLVVMGMFDFGLMFQRYELITNAAREGARIGVLPGYTTTDAQNRALQYLSSANLTGASVSATTSTINVGTPSTPTTAVTVTVTYTHNFLWIGPIIKLFGGTLGSNTLTAISTMRQEAS